MKFRCEREALAEAFSTASRAVAGRSAALPVLSGLRLELSGQQLTVTGTDLDLTIQLGLEVGGERDGSTVVQAKLAADIVRSLGTGAVEFVVEGDEVVISNSRSRFTLRPMNIDDYPKLAAPVDSAVTLPAAQFGDSLRQVVRATSSDEMRPVLTGVMMTAEADGLRMVATDTYRLAVRDLAGHQVLSADQRVIVPGRALTELQRLVGGADEITMRLGERHATFEIGAMRLTTRLLDGEFPPYRHLIPDSSPNVLTVERDALLEAIRRVKILAKDATPIRLQMGGDTLRVTAITQDVGNAAEELDCSYVGEDLVMAFNPEYFAAGVEACAGDSVTLSASVALKPAIVRGVGSDDYLYLLMPVRVP